MHHSWCFSQYLSGLLGGCLMALKGNAIKVNAMDALAIKGLGLGGEARLFGLIWPAGQPLPFLVPGGTQEPEAHHYPDNRKGIHCLASICPGIARPRDELSITARIPRSPLLSWKTKRRIDAN